MEHRRSVHVPLACDGSDDAKQEADCSKPLEEMQINWMAVLFGSGKPSMDRQTALTIVEVTTNLGDTDC
jgi:hypothetical protein